MSLGDRIETQSWVMTQKRRELFLRIVDNRDNFHPITTRLYFLEEHFPYDKLDAALLWLVKNNYVGAKFVMWFRSACNGSDLEMHTRLLQIVNNESLAPVIAGKNFRV